MTPLKDKSSGKDWLQIKFNMDNQNSKKPLFQYLHLIKRRFKKERPVLPPLHMTSVPRLNPLLSIKDTGA
jgi:hypothetical protein